MRQFSIAKLLINLLIIVCLIVAVWSGYVLFTHQTNPIWGTIIFLAAIGVLIWNTQVLRSRHYRLKKPSFKLVFFSLLGIFLVCAFAGIQPLAAYKDNTVSIAKEGIDKLTTLVKTTITETNKETSNSKGVTPVANDKLHGTYTATVATFDPWLSASTTPGVKRTATFKGNTITFYDEVFGKTVYEYSFLTRYGVSTRNPKFAQEMDMYLINLATGKSLEPVKFRYSAELDCFTIGEGVSAVTYYK